MGTFHPGHQKSTRVSGLATRNAIMKNDKPLVTYIVPCFNQGEFLFEAISSIYLSYSGPKEIIVINDCSTNASTIKHISSIEKTFTNVQIIHNEDNRGLAETRNHGIALSTGEFVQFLDADDLLLPGKIDLQIQHFQLSRNLDVSITDYLFADGELVNFSSADPSIGSFALDLDDFLFKWERGLSIPIHCALFRLSTLKENLFIKTLTAKEDWVFWCKLAYEQIKMAFLNYYGVVYRQHSGAMTKNRVGEMAKMWVKAALTINDFINRDDGNAFLSDAIAWYTSHYQYALSLTQNTQPANDFLPPSNRTAEDVFHDFALTHPPSTKHSHEIFFSVIIPVYNHFDYLPACFDSVLKQTNKNYEIICVDDNSTDPRVKDFLRKIEEKYSSFKVIYNETNQGISKTINSGIEIAKGDFIAFLDCDDMLPPDALEVIDKHIGKFPQIDYFFSDKIDVDENGEFIRRANYGGYSYIAPSGDISEDLLDGMVASHLKVIRKKTLLDLGGCDTNLEGVQDYDLALKISESGELAYIHQPLYLHRQHASSVTISQSTSQFRKMNIARRFHCDKLFPKKAEQQTVLDFFQQNLLSGTNYSKSELSKSNIAIFAIENITLPDLKRHVKDGDLCILDARGKYKPEWKYFIREYNSFLDLIVTNSPELAISIMGYLWDQKILYVSK